MKAHAIGWRGSVGAAEQLRPPKMPKGFYQPDFRLESAREFFRAAIGRDLLKAYLSMDLPATMDDQPACIYLSGPE